uniref:Uncharacterized protein n=1 Tax=Brassica oleracea var. oleracea TaxID=109376 RepID=A0A0D3CCT7_BRAOL
MKIQENLEFVDVLKRARKLVCGNINLLLFLFICTLPLFCFLIFLELSLQTTVLVASEYFSREVKFWGYYYTAPRDHALLKNLISLLLPTFLLYLFPYSLLDLLTTTTIVSASSLVYTSEEEPLGLRQLVRRTVEICQNRIEVLGDGGSYTTRSSFEDLSPSRILFDSVMALFHGAIFIVLLAKFSNMGHEKSGLWVMLVFLLFALATRIRYLCLKCSESSSSNGNGVLYTSFYVGLICVGNIIKWVATG